VACFVAPATDVVREEQVSQVAQAEQAAFIFLAFDRRRRHPNPEPADTLAVSLGNLGCEG
jgi:hypothetical protein